MREEQILANALLSTNAQTIPTQYGNIDENGYPTGGEDFYNGGQKFTCEMVYDPGSGNRIFYQIWDGTAGVAISPYDVTKIPATGARPVLNVIMGGSGNDVIWNNFSGSSISGGAGNDILITSVQNTTLEGGDGDDILVAGMTPLGGGTNYFDVWRQNLQNFNNNMTESQMQSFFQYPGDYPYDFIPGSKLMGGMGNDIIISRGANDSLYGGEGQDELWGGGGHDTMYGDSRYNDDTPDFTAGNHNDSMYGGSGNDRMFGEIGNDLIYGEDGHDLILGGIGNDSIYGGNDEDELFGEDGNDLLLGEVGNDTLHGNAGDDILIGEIGNDALYGGENSDILCGGIGADTLDGGSGFDYASYETATTGVTAGLHNVEFNTGDAAGDTYTSIEGLIGSAHADSLTGDANANYLDGGAGNDTLDGGAGNDSIFGGAGNDVILGQGGYDNLVGGDGNDTYLFGFGSGYDHIFEAANGGIDNLFLAGITQIGVYRQGNHLLFAVNNDDVIVLDNWFINQAVEYIDFEAYQMRYLVSDFASQAITLQSNQILALGRENSVENIESTFIPTEGQEFQTTDVTLLGVAPVETFESVAA